MCVPMRQIFNQVTKYKKVTIIGQSTASKGALTQLKQTASYKDPKNDNCKTIQTENQRSHLYTTCETKHNCESYYPFYIMFCRLIKQI